LRVKRGLHVKREEAGARLDRWLAARLPELSRTRLQELIAEGRVRVNGSSAKASRHLAPGDRVKVDVVARPAPQVAAEDLPLDVLYEDSDMVVVNKPAGMVVHVGAGEAARRGTLVNALLHRYRVLSAGSGPGGALRPGIVHRLDKETSGVIVVARNDAAHRALAEQFESRRVEKTYLALVHGALQGASGRIELPIARDPQRRTRMTTRTGAGRAARTDWRVLARMGGSSGRGGRGGFTLVAVQLHTGRTHQIRVHFSALGHPVAGDALYGAPAAPRVGKAALPALQRNFLHAARIRLIHPRTGGSLEVRAPLPRELRDYLRIITQAAGGDARAIDDTIREFL
jgi:23S rRNA pseudouridine1911/1915/1917 synthase